MKKLTLLLVVMATTLLASPAFAAPDAVHKGKVTFARTAGGYTYLKVREADQENWVASAPLEVKVGEEVEYTGGDVMSKFRSNAMDQTFDAIRFVSRIHVVGRDATPAVKSGMPADAAHQGVAAAKGSGTPGAPVAIVKPKNGKTIAELFAGKEKLKGQNVLVRGKVLKFSKNILGKNWITLVDGSGKAPDDKIVAVTAETAAVNDVVTLAGVLKTDVNLGSGYQYKAMLDEVKLTK